jgi:hypothetical protein
MLVHRRVIVWFEALGEAPEYLMDTFSESIFPFSELP